MPNRPRVGRDEDVVRHVKGTLLDQGVLAAGALHLPAKDAGEMSCDRLGVYAEDLETDLTAIRDKARLTMTSTHRLVRINVGDLEDVSSGEPQIGAIHVEADPRPAEDNYVPQAAHALGLPMPEDTLAADLLVDLLRPLIKGYYPAKV